MGRTEARMDPCTESPTYGRHTSLAVEITRRAIKISRQRSLARPVGAEDDRAMGEHDQDQDDVADPARAAAHRSPRRGDDGRAARGDGGVTSGVPRRCSPPGSATRTPPGCGFLRGTPRGSRTARRITASAARRRSGSRTSPAPWPRPTKRSPPAPRRLAREAPARPPRSTTACPSAPCTAPSCDRCCPAWRGVLSNGRGDPGVLARARWPGGGQLVQTRESVRVSDLGHHRGEMPVRAGEHPRQSGTDGVSVDQHEQPGGQVVPVMRR